MNNSGNNILTILVYIDDKVSDGATGWKYLFIRPDFLIFVALNRYFCNTSLTQHWVILTHGTKNKKQLASHTS